MSYIDCFTGFSNMQEKNTTSSSKLYVKEVTNLVSGSLKLTVSFNGPYTLQVTGSSPIDFTYQLLEVEDMERGTTRRVVGNPLRGKVISWQTNWWVYFPFSVKQSDWAKIVSCWHCLRRQIVQFRSPLLGAWNSHNQPMERQLYRPGYF